MTKIVFLGDSITAEVDVTLTNRWPYKVGISANYLAENIINAGIPGNRSDQMITRLQTDVLAHNPDVVVMMFTVNDKVNGITLAQHESNYQSMITSCKNIGAKVVLMSPPMYRSAIDTWETWLVKWSELAAKNNCVYVDVWGRYSNKYIASQSTFESLYADATVHQTVAGNAFIHSIAIPNGYNGIFLKQATAPAPSEGVSEQDFNKVKDLSVVLGELIVNTLNPSSTGAVQDALASVNLIGQSS